MNQRKLNARQKRLELIEVARARREANVKQAQVETKKRKGCGCRGRR